MPETPKSFEEQTMTDPCEVPPRRWKCNRAKGHDGPCAPVPLLDLRRSFAQEAVDLLESQGDGYAYAHERIIGLLQLEARQCAICGRNDGWHKAEGHPPPPVGDCRKVVWMRDSSDMEWWGVRAYGGSENGWNVNGREESSTVLFWRDGPHNPFYPPIPLPPQAAAGEGRLPPLVTQGVVIPKDLGMIYLQIPETDRQTFELIERIGCREAQLREAIAQRDEASRTLSETQEALNAALEALKDVPRAIAAALDVPKPSERK